MSDNPNEPIIRDWSRAGLIIAMVVLAILGAVAIGSLKNQADKNSRALKADCALTRQLEKNRAANVLALAKSRKLIREQPNIIPGITKAQWEQSFKTQQKAIDTSSKTIRVLHAALGDACK